MEPRKARVGDLEERVKKVLVDRLELKLRPEELGTDTCLVGKGLGLDSVALLELVTGLEDELGIVFDDSELGPELFADIGSLTRYVSGKLG